MRKLLGPALRPQLARQRLGQRREAGDVGKQRRATGARGQIFPPSYRQASVDWNIRFWQLHEPYLSPSDSVHDTIIVHYTPTHCWGILAHSDPPRMVR